MWSDPWPTCSHGREQDHAEARLVVAHGALRLGLEARGFKQLHGRDGKVAVVGDKREQALARRAQLE
jgi:hypothetical protein